MPNKTYITICEELSKKILLLTSSECKAVSSLVADARKWRKHVKDTSVPAKELGVVISYYLDVKMVPKDSRYTMYKMLYRPAKDLINKCGKDTSVACRVIDAISIKFAELNWSLHACVKHTESVLNE